MGCRRRQRAWRQAAEQTSWRPIGVKGWPQTGQAIVTPTLRDGEGGHRAPPVGVWRHCAAAGLLHAERLALGDHDRGMVEQAIQKRGGGALLGKKRPTGRTASGWPPRGCAARRPRPRSGTGAGVPTSSRGAKPSSSPGWRRARSRPSMTLPTVLSARPRYRVSTRSAAIRTSL